MVKLKLNVLEQLALMICGDTPYTKDFPYRSSSKLTLFFGGADLDYRHDGSSRRPWVIDVLRELNEKEEITEGLPSRELTRVIEYLLNSAHFVGTDYSYDSAIARVNQLLRSYNLTLEEDKNTEGVILRNIQYNFISTSKEVDKTKRAITFSPSVFKVPEKSVDKNQVSVMMPLAKDFDDVFETLKTACKNVNMNCLRADKIWVNSEVIQDIFELIYCSSIVIVDISGRNPNVFYEAGIAHTLGKNVIPITQNMGDNPFDIKHHRVLEYLKNKEGLEELRKNLEERLKTLK